MVNYPVELLNPIPCEGEIILFKQGTKLSGKVVVLDMLIPTISPEFVDAKGIIVEKGGILSHSAIFARELNISCIRLKDATKILRNRQKIILDLKKSIIYVEEVK